jgi:hypothetical protein
VALLDDLIERYGINAILTVHPHMPGGEILRWQLMMTVTTYARRTSASVSVAVTASCLTDTREEIELTRWREGAGRAQGPPASLVERLGALQRRSTRA